jgi:hypothetical protein
VNVEPLDLAAGLRLGLVRLAARALFAAELAQVVRGVERATGELEGAISSDVPIILDELATDDAVIAAMGALARIGRSFAGRRLAFVGRLLARLPRPDWPELGSVGASYMQLGFAYLEHAERALEVVRAELGPGTEGDALDAVYDPSVPPQVSRLVLEVRRSNPCLIALLGADRLSRGRAVDLAERFMLAERGRLVLLATHPRVEVPEDVLPLEHRLDLEALSKRWEATRAELRATAPQAPPA